MFGVTVLIIFWIKIIDLGMYVNDIKMLETC